MEREPNENLLPFQRAENSRCERQEPSKCSPFLDALRCEETISCFVSASHQDGAHKSAHDMKPRKAVKQPRWGTKILSDHPMVRKTRQHSDTCIVNQREREYKWTKKRINTFTPLDEEATKREEEKEGERDARDQRDQTRRSARRKASQVKKFENKRSVKHENKTHTHTQKRHPEQKTSNRKRGGAKRKKNTHQARQVHSTAKDQTCCDTASRVAERTQKNALQSAVLSSLYLSNKRPHDPDVFPLPLPVTDFLM